MTEVQVLLIVIAGVVYTIFGALIAVTDISNKEIVLPGDFRSDGYNWFGSWTIFLIRTLTALPFWIIGTIIYLIYKLVMWLFTVGGGNRGSN